MFNGIARRYDLLNTMLSLGIDHRWRCVAAEAARLEAGDEALDVCCGTGKLAEALHRTAPDATIIGADFSREMLATAIEDAGSTEALTFVPILADALELPFPDATFDAVTVGFGIRNVADLERGIAEMARVAKPGGRVVILEFTPPTSVWCRPLFSFYLNVVLPWVGNLISRSDLAAYTYLPKSVQAFPDPEALAAAMEACGLVDVEYSLLTFGVAAIHVGTKREDG